MFILFFYFQKLSPVDFRLKKSIILCVKFLLSLDCSFSYDLQSRKIKIDLEGASKEIMFPGVLSSLWFNPFRGGEHGRATHSSQIYFKWNWQEPLEKVSTHDLFKWPRFATDQKYFHSENALAYLRVCYVFFLFYLHYPWYKMATRPHSSTSNPNPLLINVKKRSPNLDGSWWCCL